NAPETPASTRSTRFAKQGNEVAPAPLGLVEGGVGLLQEQLGQRCVIRVKRYAHAECQRAGEAIASKPLLRGALDPLTHCDCVRRIIQSRQQQNELVAAPA